MKKKVYAYLHTHWDLEWYRDEEDFNIRFLEVFDIVLDELKNNRAPFFYLDGQTIALVNYLKYRPEKKDEIKELIKEKKLAIGPYYVSADSFLVSYPFMLKNLDIGLEISKEFSQKEYVGYSSDIFGVSKSVFNALKSKNINKSIIWRGVNPKKIKNNCNFIKDNIDTVWLSQGYFNDYFHQEKINPDNIKSHLKKIEKYSPDSILLPIGADHLGMLKNASEKIKKINKELDNYEIILTSPFEYFKKNKFENKILEDEFLDNSDTYILQGVYSARIPQKIRNNELQNKISRIVEPLNYFLKDKYKNNIEELYKTIITNHAHDGIYGCSLDSVHKTIEARLDKCENMSNAIIKRLVGNFKNKYSLKDESKNEIGIFNLSNGNINVVEVKLPYILKNSQITKKEKYFPDDLYYDIYKIPVTEDITALYSQLIEISSNECFAFNTVKIKKPIKKVKVSDTSIENNFIKLEIKNNQITVSDKKTNEKFYLNITDVKDNGDSYNCAPVGKYEILKPIKSKVGCDGDIQCAINIYFKNIVLEAILDNHSRFLKFIATINNKKKNHKVQLSLSLKDNIKQTISQEAYGIIKRKINYKYNIQNFMPVKNKTELKTNTYPMQNFVCTNGVCVITKGLHEYEVMNNELKICLLRCFSTISNPKNPVRGVPAGPDIKTPQAQCIGEHKSEFAVFFGNHKKAFKYLDNFFQNYIMIDGCYKNKINFKLAEISDNEYVYGINKNKIVTYKFT